MIVMKIRGFPITVSLRNLYPWINLLVSILDKKQLLFDHKKIFDILVIVGSHVYLAELGVLSWRLDADNYETDEELKKIREERGYSYMVCTLFYHYFLYFDSNANK